MQLVIFALLGCCALANSASLSDTLRVSPVVEGAPKGMKAGAEAEAEAEADFVASPFEPADDTSRSKRSGGGSGGFLAGIGSAILGKVASASSGLSSGSGDSGSSSLGSLSSLSSGVESGREHHYESIEYGAPVYGHDENNFDIWAFKKAILNTLFQALKAIGGGVIALKGKLIKGGGVIVSTKGRLISAKGEAISNFGRQIAASAVLSPPKHTNDYIYETPVHHLPSAEHHSYGGPPPSVYDIHSYSASASSDSYGHSGYAAPSDDAAHPGLLIAKSLASVEGRRSYRDGNGAADPKQSVPSNVVEQLSESFGGNQKDSGLGETVGRLTESSNSIGPSIASINAAVKPHGEVGSVAGDAVHPPENNIRHQLSGNYGIREPSLQLPLASNGPVQFYGNLEQRQQFSDTDTAGHDGDLRLQPFGFPGLMISRPIEVPILRTQPAYYQGQNFLRDYYNQVKRSGVIGSGIKIEPAIGYAVRDSRAWRI